MNMHHALDSTKTSESSLSNRRQNSVAGGSSVSLAPSGILISPSASDKDTRS